MILFYFQRRNKVFNRLIAAIIGCAIPVMVSNLMHFLKVEWLIERVFLSSSIATLYYPLCIMLFHETLKIPLKKGWKFHLYMWGPVAYYIVLSCWYSFNQDVVMKENFVHANLYYQWESSFLMDFI